MKTHEQNSLSISVVTPNYNMGDYLSDTIVSVLGNLKSCDEYFVIDGGSSDNSREVIKRFDGQLTDWVSEPDRGYADAIAKGFAAASGDILCWVNSGDLLLSGALDNVRSAFASHDAELLFGDDFYIDEESRVIRYSRGFAPDLKRAMLLGSWTPLQDACYWRRSAYEQVGGIDPTISSAADYDLFLRLAVRCRSAYIPIAFSAFRRHPGQKSISDTGTYASEKERIRRRELAAAGCGSSRVRSVFPRLMTSLRSRFAARLWVRRDLIGRPIGELPSGRYWPPSISLE